MINLLFQAQEQSPPFKLAPRDSYWMPPQASTVAADLDWLYYALYWLSVVSAVAILGVMAYFVVKYRAKSREANERAEETSTHNTTLEILWSVPPLIIVIPIFVAGFRGYVDLRTVPQDSYEIHVTGQKWKWLFTYNNGLVTDELHVPPNRNIRTIVESVDVLHAFWIPAFRVKMDAVPGRYTDVWFNATKPGEYVIECAEYCGTSHSDMLAKVIVHEDQLTFDKWMADEIKKLDDMPPVELGEKMYTMQGCETCHSTDGSAKTGPTFKGLFGKTEPMADGSSVTVDENYIRESILEPQAKIVQGYPPSMPTYQGKMNDKRIKGIIEYIKTLK